MVDTLRDPRLGWNQPTQYERWCQSSLGRAYAVSLARVLRPWLAQAVDSPILDVGCGPGLTLEALCPAGAEIIGMDCSFEMARRALARSRPSFRPWQFVVGSVQEIPFADESFDLAFCVNCLEFVTDREAAFAEIARVLRPRGRAILGVLNRRGAWELARRIRRPFSRHAYYRGRFFAIRDLSLECTKAGLRIDRLKTVVHFPPIPPGPLVGIYHCFDRWFQRHSVPGGGVILCVAIKPE